jgi:VCBS repeat-containing protein
MTATRRTVLSVLGIGGIAAADFSAALKGGPQRSEYDGSWHFSFDNEKAVKALRAMADEIEAGRMHIQALDVSQSVAIEDFAHHKLSIEFVMREIANG